MRPQVNTVTGVGISPWIPLNYTKLPFAVGLAAVITGTATYSVEYTYDDILNAATPFTVFTRADLLNQTTNKDGSFTTPISAIRLNVSASTGSVTLTTLQGTPA